MVYGCLPAKVDLRDYKVCAANASVEYPTEFALTNLPPVKNQGNVGSCCAHATSSILEYFAQNKVKLSTNFIYGIQKSECGRDGKGMYLVDACKIVRKYGDMLEVDCAGNTEVPVCYDEADAALADQERRLRAYEYRTISYYACNTADDIKYALMNYGPVLAAIDWYGKYSLDSEGVITFDKSVAGGGHAVMIYGWTQKGWLIQNSWGTSFGRGGRFILPFAAGPREARAMVDYEEQESDTTLVVPKNNELLNIIYKILNWLLNLVEQSQYSAK